jgi:hypothetical protein
MNGKKQLHHTAPLLISLHVIETHSAIVLTCCDQTVDGCCHSAAHNFCSHAHLHHTLGTGLHVPLSHFGQQVIHITLVNFTKLQYVVPLSSASKFPTIHSNLTFHIQYIMFQEKVSGTFKEMGRIKYSCNFSILKHEEKRLFRNTHLLPGLDTDGTHVTRGGNNFQFCIVAGIKNFHQEINKHVTFSAPMNQVLSHWLLPLSMQTTEHENQGMISNTACPAMASKVLKALNTA